MEADGEFRARVAIAAGEEELGRAGFVYLTRPEGWEAELATLTEEAGAAAEEAAAAAAEEQDERQARRRLRGAEDARRQAEQALADGRAAMARATADLESERKLRRDAERRLAAAEADRDKWRRTAESAAVAVAKEEKGAPSPDPAVTVRAVTTVTAQAEAMAAAREAVLGAAGALAAVEEALTGAAEVLAPPAAPVVAPRPAALPPSPPARRAPPARSVRRPAPLPPGTFDDSAEAAEHLVRVPGVVVLVDGYNVGFLAWPQLPVQDIRDRLVDALGELAARTAAELQVVFDGADGMEAVPIRATARSRVRVRFSPPDVEADDVIIGLAGSLPPDRPVVVATNDRRVQDEVRRLGARTLSSGQFLGVLRRAAGG